MVSCVRDLIIDISEVQKQHTLLMSSPGADTKPPLNDPPWSSLKPAISAAAFDAASPVDCSPITTHLSSSKAFFDKEIAWLTLDAMHSDRKNLWWDDQNKPN